MLGIDEGGEEIGQGKGEEEERRGVEMVRYLRILETTNK